MILVKKICILFFCSVASVHASSFESCQLKVKIQRISDEIQTQKKEKGFKLQMDFKTKKLVEGKCSKLIGKELSKDVLVRSKQTLHQLAEGKQITLDYSNFSAMSKKGSALSLEKWKIVSESIERGVDIKSSK